MTRSAIHNRIRNWLGRLKYRPSKGQAQDNDAAFSHYFARLLRELPGGERRLEVLSNQRLTSKGGSLGVYELRFRCPPNMSWKPGDLLLINWRNTQERVSKIRELLGLAPKETYRVWTYGNTFSPERLAKVTSDELLTSVIDLSKASPSLIRQAKSIRQSEVLSQERVDLGALLSEYPELAQWSSIILHQTRIKPRIYTVSRIPSDLPAIEILVSTIPTLSNSGNGLGNSSGYLSQLAPGTQVTAFRLPHPHRLPIAHGHDGPGVCIVTGSGIAGVLAFLRANAAPKRLWLIWGLKCRESHLFYRAELERMCADGRITRFDVVESKPISGETGSYVQDWLGGSQATLHDWLNEHCWFYISGHSAMGQAVRASLAESLVKCHKVSEIGKAFDLIEAWEQSLRYIETTSG